MRDEPTVDTASLPLPSSGGAAYPAPGEILAGRFVLLAELGRGGCGTVFQARDLVLDAAIALKVIHPHLADTVSRERLRREVRSSRGKHPNAAAVYDLHESDGHVFLTMELVEGSSLRTRLAEDGRLSVERTVQVGASIAAALVHLHGDGVVHRDLKPGNIIVRPDGRAVLCDMGLVRSLEDDLTLTATNLTVGTPAYMAPEQATRTELTPATDVYALGLTLYQCLTGELPMTGESSIATLMQRQKGRPPSLRRRRPEVARWLERLVRWMLEPRPADRPTAAQVAQAFARERVGRALTPRELRRGAAAALAVVALGALGWWVGDRRPPAAVRVELSGREALGLDRRGDVVWRRSVNGLPRQQEQTDLDGDGRDETVVVAAADPYDPVRSAGPSSEGEVLVLDADGGILLRSSLADIATASVVQEYPPHLAAKLFLLDLDGDGRDELVLAINQTSFYPAVLTVYWPVQRRWDPLLAHAGWFRAVAVAPDEPRRLQFLATANLQGLLPVVGELTVLPPSAADPSDLLALQLGPPDEQVDGSRRCQWSFYTPLPPGDRGVRPGGVFVQPTPAGIRYAYEGSPRLLDRWGNPAGSPNAGRDRRAERLDLQHALAMLKASRGRVDNRTVDDVLAALAAIEERHAQLLREPALRVVADLTAARALARAGAPAAAVDRLRQTVERWPWEDVVYRLAHLEALTGDLGGARQRLDELVTGGSGGRAEYDGPQLLIRLAIQARDAALLRREISTLQSRVPVEHQPAITAALWARARLWWDAAIPSDTAAAPYRYAPAGGAVACLARWRLGQTRPDDARAMRAYAAAHPDARWEARLAEGAARLARGEAGAALAVLDELVNVLEPRARDDFANLQVLQLARAVRLQALAAAGQPDEAARQARALRPELSPGLLPVILLDEVLASAGAAPGRTARMAPIAAP